MDKKNISEMISGSELVMSEDEVTGIVHHSSVILTPDTEDELMLVVKSTNATVVTSGKGASRKRVIVLTAELPDYLFEDADKLKIALSNTTSHLAVSLPSSVFKAEVQLGCNLPHGLVFGRSKTVKKNPAPDIIIKGDT